MPAQGTAKTNSQNQENSLFLFKGKYYEYEVNLGNFDDNEWQQFSSRDTVDFGGMINRREPIGFFEFIISSEIVPDLIGKNGVFLKKLIDRQQIRVCFEKLNNPRYPNSTLCHIRGPDDLIHEFLQRQDLLHQYWFDGVVTYFMGPYDFCIQNRSPSGSYEEFLKLEIRLCHFYRKHKNFPTLPAKNCEGMMAVVFENRKWVRCLVTKHYPNTDLVTITKVDYGGEYKTHRSKLKSIRTDFSLFPCQAINVRLANIRPGPRWCLQDACNLMAAYCYLKEVCVRWVSPLSAPIKEVEMLVPILNGNIIENYSFDRILIDSGLASSTRMFSPTVDFVQL
ncbi:unnamed protein product [Caenorhabditis bovis]|uniref:Tudor domain-containing protein n=1 Tax=Caenorhabditis bovis TaxID=2654633 RepID=A0A8S1EHS8_9PELO|nr:unnamed protein product [Caenorhabditis bovis]